MKDAFDTAIGGSLEIFGEILQNFGSQRLKILSNLTICLYD